MPTATTLKTLPLDEALKRVDEGAVLIDLRPTGPYLEVHIPGSICLLYEFGPGMAARARDCLPLDLPLILIDAEDIDMANAAAALRGKGFRVLGRVLDAVNAWAGSGRAPASTEVATGEPAPEGQVLDVGDPGARPPPEALRVPVDRLWSRTDELGERAPVVVVSGFGVRAALALGVLERAGREVVLWATRT
jgi:rhodanese-related sulfurtransferase